MYDIEDEVKLFEAKEKAHGEGMTTGLLFGIPLGTIGTLFLMWLTMDAWLPLVK